MSALDLDAIRERAYRAHEEVVRLCETRHNWRWTIPANAERDSDLVLDATAMDALALVAAIKERDEEIAAMEARFDQYLRSLVSRVIDVFEDAEEDALADDVLPEVLAAMRVVETYSRPGPSAAIREETSR